MRYFRNVAATGRSCNVRPESSSVPDVGTRTQEIITVGETSEQKIASADAKGKWKRFSKKRYDKKIAATVKSSKGYCRRKVHLLQVVTLTSSCRWD